MKKCPKCEITFDDGSKFCPNCGTELVEVIETPIEEVKEEVVEKREDKTPEAASKKEISPEGKSKAKKIISIIVAGLCLFAMTFIVIGVFGDVFQVRSFYGDSASIGLKYFFKTYPENLENIRSQVPGSMYYYYSLFMFIIECILYFGGIVACVILSIFAIIKNIQAITKRGEPNIKLVFGAACSMLPIMLFLGARLACDYNVGLETDFGWGASFIIIGLVFTLIAISTRKIALAIIDKNNLLPAIFRSSASLVLLILLFNAFFPLSTVSVTYGGVTERIRVSGIMFAESTMMDAAIASTSLTGKGLAVIILGLVSFFVALAGLAFMFLAFTGSNKDKKVSPIVFAGISMMVLIIAAVLSLAASTLMYGEGSNPSYSYAFTGGVVAGIVFLHFIMAALILAAAFTKKKAE